MNDVSELKAYIEAHARGQRVDDFRDVLRRIESDHGAEPGSWVAEWCRSAENAEQAGDLLGAARRYALARFPFVDGPARQDALNRAVAAVDRWCVAYPEIQPLEIKLDDGRVRCWTAGLSVTERKPLLVFLGGNVTVKEQWAPMLVHARRLGMAAVVTEMPSCGENTLPYTPDSWRMLSVLLDELADRADVSRTHLTALSLSGHLALRCAVEDQRIRGVVTVGAPVRSFFTDADWQAKLPRITTDSLVHMTGADPWPGVGGWELTDEQLRSLDIPLAYSASLRDEIIPYDEVRVLKRNVRNLALLEHDDVHAAPGHVRQTQLWTTLQLLRARGVRGPQVLVLRLMLALAGRRGA
ncbi:alpha/beta hydrolase [Micromonospora endolithica]|uniref:Alpha/beta hydrolase n=1 Tax=Micromonospora endolithica TaxID=230091 RepID=A0A3A9ZPZ4_9ACTN|nr:alpha/beta hydrolase [Micromonospora endolithica]RKN50255.1 alpha/beta hydrolase [Micromonospora endolithica]TWJ21104.1 alpha/beta hydrolase family protein DUF1100 [Micromonospora endolithica]